MKTRLILIILTLIASVSFGQVINDTYRGLIEMCYTDNNGIKHNFGESYESNDKWYHLSYLKVMVDSVYFEMNPVYLAENGDTIYSASEGGFYFFKGTISYENDSVLLDLKGVHCEYCTHMFISETGDTVLVNHDRKYHGKLENGNLIIQGNLFGKASYDFFIENETYWK